MPAAHSTTIELRLLSGVFAAVLTALLVLLTDIPCEPSWLIDSGRFHVSAHGQISCLECHGDIPGEGRHPDPRAVNKQLNDFFTADRCAACHDDVVDGLNSGIHAGKPVEPDKQYGACLGCHDPHYQLAGTRLPEAFVASQPVAGQCSVCHAMKTALPALPPADEGCMVCHRRVEAGDPDEAKKTTAFCIKCHGDRRASDYPILPAIDTQSYGSSAHAKLSCFACHPDSAEFNHAGRERTGCLHCHNRHDEKVANDAHIAVSCEACHLSGVAPVRAMDKVLWRIDRKPDRQSDVHNMTLKHDENSCRRCHYSGNTVGAAAMVLPPKSVLCMPCHAATFSASDTTTVISLFFFLLGMAGLCILWFSPGSSAQAKSVPESEASETTGEKARTRSSHKTLHALKGAALDVLLQRRLFRQSFRRWFIHTLVFWPFAFRFLWGAAALLMSLYVPKSPLPWRMLDENNPPGAFLFDLSGLMILAGVFLMAHRKIADRSQRIPGLPKQDWAALFLLGGIVITGFIVEGMRIAMAGSPSGTDYAFLGYALSRLFVGNTYLAGIYGYIWYLHAIMTGALVAYLPFSSLLHMITAPVATALNAVFGTDEPGHKRY
jgi:nitrate reductase gamma subunit